MTKSNHILLLPLLASVAWAIWPIPTTFEHGDATLLINPDVTFHWRGENYSGSPSAQMLGYLPSLQNTFRGLLRPVSHFWQTTDDQQTKKDEIVTGDEMVQSAIQSAWRNIFEHNFVPWKFHERGWRGAYTERAHSISSVSLVLTQDKLDHESNPELENSDRTEVESYNLKITESGKVEIAAPHHIGLVRGLVTLTQLFYLHPEEEDVVYTSYAPVEITDKPVFQHRGINLDVARQWYPPSVIKRHIDAAAYNKMNRFHLHVTDSQSWPLEIPSLPELAKKGAHRPQYTYSPEDFTDLQRHAALQGVQLITEIDMPGHTSSIWHSQPDLVAAFDMQPDWQTYAAEPPSGTLKLQSPAVDQFLDTLFKDLLPRVQPYTNYFHTGGDEVNMNAYKLDDTVRSNDKEVLRPLMQKFIDRNHERVRKAGLTPIVWEEMLLEWDLELGDDVVVQSWRSDEAVRRIAERGHKVIVGNYRSWYLDCGKGQWLDFDPSISSQHYPYQDYCAPFHNWRLVYSYDPLSNIPKEQHHLVIGGEVHMWNEQTDPVNVDQMIWPRAAAAAEVLWSGVKDEYGRNRSQIEASPRLSEMRERLVRMGVGAEPVQMPYCLMSEEGQPKCQLGYTGRS